MTPDLDTSYAILIPAAVAAWIAFLGLVFIALPYRAYRRGERTIDSDEFILWAFMTVADWIADSMADRRDRRLGESEGLRVLSAIYPSPLELHPRTFIGDSSECELCADVRVNRASQEISAVPDGQIERISASYVIEDGHGRTICTLDIRCAADPAQTEPRIVVTTPRPLSRPQSTRSAHGTHQCRSSRQCNHQPVEIHESERNDD